jgi:hypothetical protein
MQANFVRTVFTKENEQLWLESKKRISYLASRKMLTKNFSTIIQTDKGYGRKVTGQKI